MILRIIGGIILIVVLLFLLICLLRVGAEVSFQDRVEVSLRIGPVKRKIFPPGSSPRKAAKKKEEPPGETAAKKVKKRTLPKLSAADLKEAFAVLGPVVCRALDRTRRKIRISPLQLSLTLGGLEDPAGAAEAYGLLQAAVWSVMPALERYLVIPDPFIHLDVDFQAEDLRLRGQAGVTARIGALMIVGLGAGIPALRWFIKLQKRKDKEQKNTKNPDTPAKAAA